MDRRRHWQTVWTDRDPTSVSWFQRSADLSFRLVRQVASHGASVIDVGGGDSPLAGQLVSAGYDVTVLDVASEALDRSRERLGDQADHVTFIEGDVLSDVPERRFDVWHDRAVFHFLTDPTEVGSYTSTVRDHLPAGAHAVIATFALTGPESCSGLPVRRYDADGLASAFGAGFELVITEQETHVTPSGANQDFTYAVLRRS